MNIDENNKPILIFFACLFAISGLMLVYGGIEAVVQKKAFESFINFIFFIVSLFICLFLLKSSEYARKFDEVGIHLLRKGTVYRTIRWDEYITAYFKYGFANRTIIVYLSPVDIKSKERGRIFTDRFIKENGVYSIMFSSFQVGSKEFKQIISFIEQKYSISYERKIMG